MTWWAYAARIFPRFCPLPAADCHNWIQLDLTLCRAVVILQETFEIKDVPFAANRASSRKHPRIHSFVPEWVNEQDNKHPTWSQATSFPSLEWYCLSFYLSFSYSPLSWQSKGTPQPN